MTNYAPCPHCGAIDAEKVSFTWWGGLLGPKLLNHVKCRSCTKGYNGKTGKDNTTGILIYSLVVFGVVLAFAVIAIAVVVIMIAAN